MKKILCLALLVSLLAACQNNEEERQIVIGKWRYDPVAIIEDARERGLPEVRVQAIQGAMTIYQNVIFDFKEDGTLIMESPSSSPISGTWRLTPNGEKMAISLSSEGVPGELLELSEERIIISSKQDSTLQFTRIFIPAE